MKLPAIEHVQLENERRIVQIQAVAGQIPPCLLDKVLHRLVKDGEFVGKLLGTGLHERELLRHFVNVHDIHGRRPERAEHGRKREGHSFRNVSLVSFRMRGTRPASNEKNEFLRAVASEMNFLHDRGSHIAVDDFSYDHRAFFHADSERLGDLVAHRLNRAILVQSHLSAEIVFRV